MMLNTFYMPFCDLYIFFGEMSVQNFGLFFNWVVFLWVIFKRTVYFGYQCFIRYVFCDSFLLFCGLYFHSLNTFFLQSRLSFSFFFFYFIFFYLTVMKSNLFFSHGSYFWLLRLLFLYLPLTYTHYATHSQFLYLFILKWFCIFRKVANMIEFLYIFHPASLNNNVLHNHDRFIKIKKPTMEHAIN